MTVKSDTEVLYDIVVIGGGINGAGIAADATGRGLSVALLEGHDFAGGTSSASSKLSHGGLRYLEQFEFRLVREALGEREVLLKKAPHLVWPLRFALPLMSGMRPAWLIRVGLFLYDSLARRESLPRTESVKLASQPDHMGFVKSMKKAFIYSDCWVDDARLVIANLLKAQENGAAILDRTQMTSAKRVDGLWEVATNSTVDGTSRRLRARAIVNAAGPWVEPVSDALGIKSRDFSIRRVKGSHIVVPKLYEGDHASLLQLKDGRVLLLMPYECEFTLVGTTDVEVHGEVRDIQISDDEADYLLNAINQCFQRQTAKADVIWSYAGVRPLYENVAQGEENPSKVTRDYAFRVDGGDGRAPVLTVLGGKLTTYRKLADHALGELGKQFMSMGDCRTATEILPGGDLGIGGQREFIKLLRSQFPWLPRATAQRFTRQYGSRSFDLIGDSASLSDMGRNFGADLTEREVTFLCETEWARSADDILWRRTKLGLHLSAEEVTELDAFLAPAATEIRYECV